MIGPAPAFAQFGEVIAFESPGNTVYYLDADTGDDENPGTRANLAWKSLSQVNTTRFAPGDKLLIKAGTAYHGRLWPKGSGVPGNPITIDSYGDGPRPAIHAQGKTNEALLLENTQAWHVKNLELTNTGDQPEPFRYGVNLVVEDIGTAGDFQFVNLYIHDVNGSPKPGMGEGGGIIWRNHGSNVPTRFDGLLVEHCVIEDCGRNGITSDSSFTDRRRWLSNLNIIVRENNIKRVQGDGIRMVGCENPVVEYNRVQQPALAPAQPSGGAGRIGGIVLQSCDNALVQYNEVWHVQNPRSAALQSGANGRNNALQFNYTHDNAGPSAAVVCQDKPKALAQTDVGNVNTAVRYNISQNDGGAFLLAGPVTDARVHNNTIYTGPDSGTVAVTLLDRGGWPQGTTFANNLFYTQGRATLSQGQAPGTRFLNNAYFGQHQRPADELNAITLDPLLADPGTGTTGRDSLDGYQLLKNSPLRNAGTRLITGHGGHDFWAHPLPGGPRVDIGAHQAPSE